MPAHLLTHIKQLVNIRTETTPVYGKDMAELPCLADAWLLIEGQQIAGYGKMSNLEKEVPALPSLITDCSGKLVLPAWCDSHTHIVFGGSRESEFVDKISGLNYSEINARGGGILSTVRHTHDLSENELFQLAWTRLEEIARLGTGAVEIKSGYGLSLESELKMLRVIRSLREKSNLEIRSTFLGAHTYPLVFRDRHDDYIRDLAEKMIPAIANEKLADYIDVFCETGFFSPEESETILRAGLAYGMGIKMHTNQLHSIGGIETGIKLGALSLDHLENMPATEIDRLESSGYRGFCTLLPTAAYFLRMPWPPARNLIQAGMAVALASDYNPGSSPSGNMNVVVSMACIQMKMLPEEALNAATINGAYAMGLGRTLGSITKGKRANLIITQPVPSLAFLPYRFGSNLIDRVILGGEFVK